MGLGDTFAFYFYVSDDGTSYAIKLSALDAAAGGLASGADPATDPVWPYGARLMRHVEGKSSSGTRTRLPCGSNTNALYVSGGSFSLRGVTYSVLGQIGEARRKNHIG